MNRGAHRKTRLLGQCANRRGINSPDELILEDAVSSTLGRISLGSSEVPGALEQELCPGRGSSAALGVITDPFLCKALARASNFE